ncbi:MAG: IclR family transcriptional regulator [Firmicutes bacterium]|jgi:DNA-binding IclR family transcriptional regulator|nr:IclR family transcriptional regulator [Bacillota bacterium]
MSEKDSKPRVIQSVQRALDIIECFDEINRELTLSEISHKLGLNKSTVHGIIKTLSVNEYIDQNISNGKYLLSPKLLGKYQLVFDSMSIRLKEIGSYYLKELSLKYKASSRLFSFKNNRLIFLEMIKPTNSYYTISSVTGYPIPLNATASGKMVLSNMTLEELDQYLKYQSFEKYTEKTLVDKNDVFADAKMNRENGYCIEDEEIEIGIYSVACPIYDGVSMVGVLSITGSVEQLKHQTKDMIKDMMEYSKKITKELTGN